MKIEKHPTRKDKTILVLTQAERTRICDNLYNGDWNDKYLRTDLRENRLVLKVKTEPLLQHLRKYPIGIGNAAIQVHEVRNYSVKRMISALLLSSRHTINSPRQFVADKRLGEKMQKMAMEAGLEF